MNSSAIRSPTTRTKRLENVSTSASSRSLRSASPGSGWTERAINISQFDVQTTQNPIGGGGEVVHDRIRRNLRGLRPITSALCGPHQDAAGARRARQFDVAPLVADDERARRIQTQLARRAIDESDSGLAAFAGPRVFRDAAVG